MNDIGVSSEQLLAFEDLLPLTWRELSEELTALDLMKLDDKNEHILKCIEVLDEYNPDPNSERSPINQELAKLDFKFDILLSLITDLLRLQIPPPKLAKVKLSSQGLQWYSAAAPARGTFGIVELIANSRYPAPLNFAVKVDEVEAEESDGYRISAQFVPMSAAVRDRLEKMIFRNHRRYIALVRQRQVVSSKTPLI